MRPTRWHGRVEGSGQKCAHPGCGEAGEFRAPLKPGGFDGPGEWRWLCLEHVRQHNSAYNFFTGMSAEEIEAAQSPIPGWERPSRAFAGAASGPGPAWADFTDPLDAIAARFRPGTERRPAGRFSAAEQQALGVLGLGEDCDLRAVRRRYSQLVRRFHPDRNGGDRSNERQLGRVIEAWQTLKAARAFA